MRITLRQLEIFVAIAKNENVSRAADSLALSQSAASSALVELERMFACALFDRVGKSLRLNATGRGLQPLAETLLAHAADVEAFLDGDRLGPLDVGATLTVGNYLATMLVAEFIGRHPKVPVQLQVANSETVIARLLHYECDIGLIEGDVSHPDLAVEPWMEDELVVFCAPGHELAEAGCADNERLSKQRWVLRERGSGTRSQFDRIVGAQLGHLDILLELEHTEAIKRTVESGLAIGCLSRLSLNEAFRRGSLVEVATPQFELKRHFSFARHRRRHVSASVKSFLQLCREATRNATSTRDLRLR